MGFFVLQFFRYYEYKTKYFNGIKESVREGIAPNGDGENRTDFLFSKEFLWHSKEQLNDNLIAK